MRVTPVDIYAVPNTDNTYDLFFLSPPLAFKLSAVRDEAVCMLLWVDYVLRCVNYPSQLAQHSSICDEYGVHISTPLPQRVSYPNRSEYAALQPLRHFNLVERPLPWRYGQNLTIKEGMLNV